jgi:hypothetical protein
VATNEAVSNAMEVVWAKVYRSHDEALAAAELS